MNKENPNPRQDTQIALLKQRLDSFEKTFDKGFKDLADKIDHFDNQLEQVVRSFNDDKQHAKFYMDEKFATKKALTEEAKTLKEYFKPVRDIYEMGKNKLAMFGAGVLLFLVMLGAISLGAVNFVKDKIMHFLH